jgi:PEP-CTERM motif
MRITKYTALVICFSVLLASRAGASVVFDGGQPLASAVTANLTSYIFAENFTLPQNTNIAGVNFWSVESPTGYSGSLYYAIYSDVSGVPNLGSPTIEGFSQGSNLTRTFVANVQTGYDMYLYTFDITPFIATSGTQYWLGLHNGPTTNTTDNGFFWEGHNSTQGNIRYFDALPVVGDAWTIRTNGSLAFQLTGQPQSAVPEPSTYILLSIALGAVGFARKKMRRE